MREPMSRKDTISLFIVVTAIGMAVAVPILADDPAEPAPAQVGNPTRVDTVTASRLPSSVTTAVEPAPPAASDAPSLSERRAKARRARATRARRARALRAKADRTRWANAARVRRAQAARAKRARTARSRPQRTAPPAPRPPARVRPPVSPRPVAPRRIVPPPPLPPAPPSLPFDDSG
jgi:hypothetical protein